LATYFSLSVEKFIVISDLKAKISPYILDLGAIFTKAVPVLVKYV